MIKCRPSAASCLKSAIVSARTIGSRPLSGSSRSNTDGMHLVISSHILHEVDMMSDSVVLLNNGYVVAEGDIHGVRDEMEEHPMQILIRCDRPSMLAARVFEQDSVVEAKIHKDRQGLFIKTRDADGFYLLLNRIVVEGGLAVESIAPVDDDLSAVYQYLIGSGG